MREAIGGTWITQLVIVIMFVFVAFLALSINYSKAFRVKNEVIAMIEKKEGVSNSSIKLINNYLKNSGYTYVGNCEEGYLGVSISNNNNGTFENATANKQYNYCIKKIKSIATNFPNRAYYEIKLFFKFNLPIVGDIFTFKVEGQTKDIEYPIDSPAGSNINTSVTPINPESDTPTNPGSDTPTNPTGGSITPTNPSGGSITPTNPSGGTITPTNPSGGTITPTNPSGGTIIPTNPSGGTITPTNPSGGTITPTNPSGGIITPTNPSGGTSSIAPGQKKKAIVIVGASQVVRMQRYVNSYNGYSVNGTDKVLKYIAKGGTGISYQTSKEGYNQLINYIKNNGSNWEYYIVLPMPGNEIKGKSCNQINGSINTWISTYNMTKINLIAQAASVGAEIKKYSVVSIQPVDPNHCPQNTSKYKNATAVVSNTNKNACAAGYRSNWKYFKFNQGMSSVNGYVDLFTKIMDTKGNSSKNSDKRAFSYKDSANSALGGKYCTEDKVHWLEATSKNYTKLMLDTIGIN